MIAFDRRWLIDDGHHHIIANLITSSTHHANKREQRSKISQFHRKRCQLFSTQPTGESRPNRLTIVHVACDINMFFFAFFIIDAPLLILILSSERSLITTS
jgi:hypothetical protein